MKQNDENKQSLPKGILLTVNKPVMSKTRRVSWGEATVKEFGQHDMTPTTNDLPNTTLNNIEEESSLSRLSSSDGNSTNQKNVSFMEVLNQKGTNSTSRITLGNLSEVIQLNQSDKENPSEINQLKNQRVTIANLRDVIEKNTLSNSMLNASNSNINQQLQQQQQQGKAKQKRYTLSFQEAYGNLLQAGNDDFNDEDDNDPLEMSFGNKNNNTNNNNNNDRSFNELADIKENINEEEEKVLKSLITPRDSLGKHMRFSISSTLSEIKYNLLNKAKDAKSGSLSADKRITIINPKELFQNSHSLKKNPTINNNLLVSPITKLNISFQPLSSAPLSSSSYSDNIEHINKRIQEEISYLTEKGNQKQQVISDLEKDMSNIQLKLNEFIEEENKITQQKAQIQQSLISLSNEYNALSLFNQRNIWFKNIFGIKVLNVNPIQNSFELLILNRIKVQFTLSNINDLINDSNNSSNKPIDIINQDLSSINITITSLSFTIINKNPNIPDSVLDNATAGNILKIIFGDILTDTIPLGLLSITVFSTRVKALIKLSASYLYLLNTLYTIFTLSSNTNLKYERERSALKIMFTLLNKQGFKLNFLFEIAIRDSFMGIMFKDLESVNVYMNQLAFTKLQNKFVLLKSQIEKYLGLKDPTQIVYRNFFYTLNDNVQSL